MRNRPLVVVPAVVEVPIRFGPTTVLISSCFLLLLSVLFYFYRCLRACAQLLVVLLLVKVPTRAQAPVKQWDKTYGGTGYDQLFTMQQTREGGYLLGGDSNSGIGGDKTQPLRGQRDYWIVMLDTHGQKLWDQTFGGAALDHLYAAQQTSDGGYLLGGQSNSGAGDDKSQPSRGGFDYWVIKLDANGNKQWDKTFGGSGNEFLWSLQQTRDGGYILGGHSNSGISGDKTQANHGQDDYWVIKVDANGNQQWDRTIGGSSTDHLNAVQQTSDGGYVLGGSSNSGISGDKTQPSRGSSDYWVVKLDATGNTQWDKAYGGEGGEAFGSLRQTRDGGYILVGNSDSGSSGDITQPSQGHEDYWVVKLDAVGNKQWDKTYGGKGQDYLQVVQQTTDGGYVLGGSSTSDVSGDKTQANRGGVDYWLVKLDAAGTKQWDQTYGGDAHETCYALQQTTDGGYVLGGYSASGLSGEKTQPNQGVFDDFWIVKLSPESVPSVVITGDSILCAEVAGRLTARGSTSPSGYEWSTGATTASIEVRQSGIYSVQVRYPGGYVATASYHVRVHASACAAALLIPNIITPNSDGLNDYFYIQGLAGSGWQLRVYNQWGRQVYHTHNYQQDWGAEAAAGLYYYLLQGQTVSKGWLEVVR
jgi:hypothetical protein